MIERLFRVLDRERINCQFHDVLYCTPGGLFCDTIGYFQLIACLFAIQTCYAYQFYQYRIPNGEVVPHPCKANYLWKGVGHQNKLGGGARNPFGLDFSKNGAVWNSTICNMDSDNDGQTNGQELGDPECQWTEGQEPARKTGLSHPGVCEPIGSDKCGPKPGWVNCEEESFTCDVFNEPETFNVTVRIPETIVQPVETTYSCMFFEYELPSDGEYHVVADMPFIDNAAVMHHLVLYGCTSNITEDVSFNTVSTCQMGSGHPDCTEVIASWTVGMPGNCLHKDIGFLMGGTKGYKFGSIQMHWNNPELRSDYTDSSGITLFMTPKLRSYNAGVLRVGQMYLEIPPGELTTSSTGGCSSSCSRRIINDTIRFTSVANHMHYLGKAQYTGLYRNGVMVVPLADDAVFSYDSPVNYAYEDGIVVQPGDEIKTTCVFQSTSRSKTTYFGEETADEMCLAFLTYYPKENVNFKACVKWGTIDSCELLTGVTQGCNLLKLRNPSDVDEMNIKRSINEKCVWSHCRKECKDYVKVLKSTNPCYRGDVYKFRQRTGLSFPSPREVTPEELEFYSRVDSCDGEIALEAYKESIESVVGETGVANELAASLVTCSLAAFLSTFF